VQHLELDQRQEEIETELSQFKSYTAEGKEIQEAELRKVDEEIARLTQENNRYLTSQRQNEDLLDGERSNLQR